MLNLQEYYKHKRAKRMNWLSVWIVILLLTAWSIAATEMNFIGVLLGFKNIANFIVYDLLPPNIKIFPTYIKPIFETVYMSFLALVFAVGISLVMAILAASNTTIHPVVGIVCRGIISFLRAIPSLVKGVFLVATFGIGTLAGILAIGISGIGILGKAYAESIEEADRGQIEAVKATGASWFQVIGQCIWPQFKPSFISWTFYKMDTNIRDASVVGLIGGGGIGYVLQQNIKLFQYKDAAFGIIVIFLLILLVEYLTTKIREKIL